MVKIKVNQKKAQEASDHPSVMGPEGLMAALVVAKQNLLQAQSAVAQYERELMEWMESKQRKVFTHEVADKKYKATFVRTTRMVVNEEGLRKHLGARAWNKITDRKFSKVKLEKALDEEALSVEDVSPYVNEVENKGYVRVSEVKSEAEEA